MSATQRRYKQSARVYLIRLTARLKIVHQNKYSCRNMCQGLACTSKMVLTLRKVCGYTGLQPSLGSSGSSVALMPPPPSIIEASMSTLSSYVTCARN